MTATARSVLIAPCSSASTALSTARLRALATLTRFSYSCCTTNAAASRAKATSGKAVARDRRKRLVRRRIAAQGCPDAQKAATGKPRRRKTRPPLPELSNACLPQRPPRDRPRRDICPALGYPGVVLAARRHPGGRCQSNGEEAMFRVLSAALLTVAMASCTSLPQQAPILFASSAQDDEDVLLRANTWEEVTHSADHHVVAAVAGHGAIPGRAEIGVRGIRGQRPGSDTDRCTGCRSGRRRQHRCATGKCSERRRSGGGRAGVTRHHRGRRPCSGGYTQDPGPMAIGRRRRPDAQRRHRRVGPGHQRQVAASSRPRAAPGR